MDLAVPVGWRSGLGIVIVVTARLGAAELRDELLIECCGAVTGK